MSKNKANEIKWRQNKFIGEIVPLYVNSTYFSFIVVLSLPNYSIQVGSRDYQVRPSIVRPESQFELFNV